MELEKKIDAYQTAFNNQDLLKLEELLIMACIKDTIMMLLGLIPD